MADYSEAYSVGDRYLDHAGAYMGPPVEEKPGISGPDPTKTSILNVKTTKTTVIDLGPGPFTVEHFRELARQLEDLPSGQKVSITYYDSQREGQTFKVTV